MVRQRASEYYAATDTTGDQAEERNGRPGYFCHVLLACRGRAERTLRRPLWFPKTSSADRIDAKRAGEQRLAERRRTRPGREFCLAPMERAIRFGLHSPTRTLPIIGATTRRAMEGNEATPPACSDDADRRLGGWPPPCPSQAARRRTGKERCRPESSRVACHLPWQTCRRHYPGGSVGDDVVQLPHDGGLP